MVLLLVMFFSDVKKTRCDVEIYFDARKQLVREDIPIFHNMLVVNMKWSKTRQFGHFRQIHIAAMPSSILCPVTAYKNMFRKVAAGPLDPSFCMYSAC